MATPTGILFNDPRAKPTSAAGIAQPGAYYQYYLTQTTTLTPVYKDGALTVPAVQTIGTGDTTLAGDGRMIPIYLNPNIIYRVQLYSAIGALLEDTDPYVVPTVSTLNVGLALYPQTPAELAIGVTPTSFQYPSLNALRYGGKGDNTTNDRVAIKTCLLVAKQQGGGEIRIPWGATGVWYVSGLDATTPTVNIPQVQSDLSVSVSALPVQIYVQNTNNIRVVFDGSQVRSDYAGGGYTFLFDGCSNLEVEKGFVQGSTIVWGTVVPPTTTFTGPLLAGATSATLTSAYTGLTGVYGIAFSDGEQRPATLTNGSTAATWTTGLGGPVTAVITTSGTVAFGVISLTQASTNVTFRDVAGNNVYSLIDVTGDPAGAFRASKISLLGNSVHNFGVYGYTFRDNGDFVHIEKGYSFGTGRPVFIYGVDTVTGEVVADTLFGGFASDLKAYRRQTRNLNLIFKYQNCYQTNSRVSFEIQHNPANFPLPAQITNVYLTIDETNNLPFTAAPAAAATSATLAVAPGGAAQNYLGSSGTYNVTFSDGEVRACVFTNGASGITWSGGLTQAVANVATGAGQFAIEFDYFSYSIANAPILAAATTATLAVNWPLLSGTFQTTFSDGETRNVTYTNGSTAITWAGGLAGNVTAVLSPILVGVCGTQIFNNIFLRGSVAGSVVTNVAFQTQAEVQCNFDGLTYLPATAIGRPLLDPHNGNGFVSSLKYTYLPVLTFGGAGVGITYGVQAADFYIANGMCTVIGIITLTSKGSSVGSAQITMPMPTRADSPRNPLIQWQGQSNMAGLGAYAAGFLSASGSLIALQLQGAASMSNVADTNFTNTSSVLFQVNYPL